MTTAIIFKDLAVATFGTVVVVAAVASNFFRHGYSAQGPRSWYQPQTPQPPQIKTVAMADIRVGMTLQATAPWPRLPVTVQYVAEDRSEFRYRLDQDEDLGEAVPGTMDLRREGWRHFGIRGQSAFVLVPGP